MLSRHIADSFYGDEEFGLQVVAKLTMEHVVLTPYSKIKKKLVTQDQFFFMNNFFDCTNVRSKTEHVRKRNEFIKPYTAVDDERLSRLKDVIMNSLEDWRLSTLTWEGENIAEKRGRCFKIYVYSHIEAIQFLLREIIGIVYRSVHFQFIRTQ